MNTPRALSTTRLVLRHTSAFRCVAESPKQTRAGSTTRTIRTTTRLPRPATPCRYYSTPAYHSYTLPSNTGAAPPPPRVETTPEPLPTVNETRPPKAAQGASPGPDTTAKPEAAPSATASTSTSTSTSPTPAAATGTTSAPAKRARPKLRARKAPMKLTPAAVEQLRLMHEGPEPKLIKVGVRNRGCSGLAYHLDWVDKPGSFDEEVVQDGVKVLIDSKALFSIIGSEMDWVEDKLTQRFVFKNPNIKEECGCGESFMIHT